MERKDIVAVDGEAGAGKSVCADVARRLGYHLLETGLLYRAATLIIQRRGINPTDRQLVTSALRKSVDRLRFIDGRITFDKITLYGELRSPELTRMVPYVAEHEEVRELLMPLQRQFADGNHIVAEGRDMGSVVFPEAKAKIYLTAKLMTRAKRRLKQYEESNPSTTMTLDEIAWQLERRDKHDAERSTAPLVRDPEAAVIDTSELTKEQAADAMYQICIEKGCKPVHAAAVA